MAQNTILFNALVGQWQAQADRIVDESPEYALALRNCAAELTYYGMAAASMDRPATVTTPKTYSKRGNGVASGKSHHKIGRPKKTEVAHKKRGPKPGFKQRRAAALAEAARNDTFPVEALTPAPEPVD